MYQMPYGGGYPPYQQGVYPPQGYPQGGFPQPGNFTQPGGCPPSNGFNNYDACSNDEDEYEYITDDEGDYVEDENGNIMSMDEAQSRGLVGPVDGEGERGIGKKLLIGGAILGGTWMLRKQLKKKKKVKKQKNNQSPGMLQQQQNLYGQNLYGPPQNNMYGQKRDIPGGPGFGGPGFAGPWL